jgi:hypothetical protein
MSPGFAKILFLIAVVVVVGALASRAPLQESFLEEEQDASNEIAVNRVFSRVLERLPTQAELADYTRLLATDQLTLGALETQLQKTDEYLERQKSARKMTQRDFDAAIKQEATTTTTELFKDAKVPPKYADTKTYHAIVDVFGNVLRRNPTPNEMDHFYDMIKTKKSFTPDTLRVLLTQTNEYHILKKNQTNAVDTELPGNASDRQVRLATREGYQKVFGSLPSPQAEEYLRSKLVEFQLDTVRYDAFLRALKAFDDMPDGNYKTLASVLKQPDLWARTSSTSSSATSGRKVAVVEGLGGGKDALRDYGWDTDDMYSNLFASQATMNDAAIRAIMSKQTLLDKDACALQADKRDGTMLAGLLKKRNDDKQKGECERFGKYVNADDAMVLDPAHKWSVPQKIPPPCIVGKKDKAIVYPSTEQSALIGTLLKDAMDTKVGSIMPKFEYKETYP